MYQSEIIREKIVAVGWVTEQEFSNSVARIQLGDSVRLDGESTFKAPDLKRA